MRWHDIIGEAVEMTVEEANDAAQRDLVPQMAQAVERLFKLTYPKVPFSVKTTSHGFSATTNGEATGNDYGFTFDQDNASEDWTAMCGIAVGEYDGRRILEFYIEDASAGKYKGVWSKIIQNWSVIAKMKRARYGATESGLNAGIDYSGGAWAKLAKENGLVHLDDRGPM